jgi:hypothetical protein
VDSFLGLGAIRVKGSNESFNRPVGIARFAFFVKISAVRLTERPVTNRTIAIIGQIFRQLESKRKTELIPFRAEDRM